MKKKLLFSALLTAVTVTVSLHAGDRKMQVKSPSFENGKNIPARFSCDGAGVNPALTVENIPAGTESLALVIEDPDAAAGTFIHWVAFNIPAAGSIEENSSPGKSGLNSAGKAGYAPPCPPSGTHRYFFRVYALDTMLNLREGVTRSHLEKVMKDHVLAEAELMGTYTAKTTAPAQ